MRIVVHDYAGHPFQVQLSRALAARGHSVLHLFSGSFSTPHGHLTRTDADAPGFEVEPIVLKQAVDKSNLLQRRQTDVEHGTKAVERIRAFKPDVVLCANTPLDAVSQIQAAVQADGKRFVFWVQDLIGIAAQRILSAKYPVAGSLVGAYYKSLERRLLAKSDGVVLISDDFRPYIPANCRDVVVIENWAPLGEMPQRPKDNEWSQREELSSTFNFLYSGTLGMKHNPELIVRLAATFRDDPKVQVIVCSQGESIEWLRNRAEEESLNNLRLLPFQPFDQLPNMLGSADVLLAVLEPSAGVFSVPSKVLSYLCAGRAMLLAVPLENLSARIVQSTGAGLVGAPTDIDAFVNSAKQIHSDPIRAAEMGRRARAYAEATFDIDSIADRFETALGAERRASVVASK